MAHQQAIEQHEEISCASSRAQSLTVLQPPGSVQFYATFPRGGTQMNILEPDTGQTGMIRERSEMSLVVAGSSTTYLTLRHAQYAGP